MAGETTSTNMGMPIPGVGSTAAPTWASDLNASLTIVDAHDHTNGNGVAITPSGMNINADLTFSSNSATSLKKAAFTSQSGALTGTNFLTFVSGNLYVNDGSGNQIPITSGGGVAGSPGSIGSLSSPAAATYSAGSKTFSWTSGSTKSAAMDNGAVTIRETDVAAAKGITLASPTSLAADYQITLLSALPASTQAMTIGAAGTMSTITYDTFLNSTTVWPAPTASIANSVAAARTRSTGTTVGVGGVAISSSINTSTTSTSFSDIANSSVTITTSGRPVMLGFIADAFGSSSLLVQNSAATIPIGNIRFNNGGVLGEYHLQVTNGTTPTLAVPISAISYIDTPVAGTYTYKAQFSVNAATTTLTCVGRLIAYEL